MADGGDIIIKKVKKGGHGHHGGAWKVAYADFVTAMMAFFLLMWLLNATSSSQKEGIAEYFTPTQGLKDSMGIGVQGGKTPLEEGEKKQDLTKPGIVFGSPRTGPISTDETRPALEQSEEEEKVFAKAEEEIKQAIESDPNLRELRDNIIIEQTPEGLKIEIVDQHKFSMFEPGSAVLTAMGKTILTKLSAIIVKMPQHISITGHTDAVAYSGMRDYSNWELSADRANSSRRFLLTVGVPRVQVNRVVGKAEVEPLISDNLEDPRNRRIDIVLLKKSLTTGLNKDQPAPRELLGVPRVDKGQKKEEAPAEKPAEPKVDVPIQIPAFSSSPSIPSAAPPAEPSPAPAAAPAPRPANTPTAPQPGLLQAPSIE